MPDSLDHAVDVCDRLVQRVKALGKNKVMRRVDDSGDIETPLPAQVRAIR